MRFDGLDLNLLLTLDVLLETRNVTAAASRLNISQPSVSAALGRLRDYFGDELLVQIGRKMVPTEKAIELSPAIKEMLNIVRFRITRTEDYDPLESRRRFRIVASDYAYDVLIAQVIAAAARLSPNAAFDISPPGPQGFRKFLDGDIDILITVSDHLMEQQPSATLYTDEDAVICWEGSRYVDGITADEFLHAKHVVAVFGQQQLPTITETFFEANGVARDIVVRLPNFAALPRTILGTDRIATLHRRHALLFAKIYPIRILPLPIPGPTVVELMQWHKMRASDHGLVWLMDLMRSEAASLS